MDSFDLKPEGSSSRGKTLIWNILTGLMLVGILCLIGYFLIVFTNPYSSLNLFPPPAVSTMAAFPTPTWTPRSLPATWTPGPTAQSTSTPTKVPTWTAIPTNTSFMISTQARRVVTSTPTRTVVSPGTPYTAVLAQLESSYYHPEAGCSWMGVAGQAIDEHDRPVIALTVHLSGSIGGRSIDDYTLTGTAPNYGQSGFEFVLGDHPVASNDSLWIQLLDQAGDPLTDQIYFDTSDQCTKNLFMVRFEEAE